ncbi:MAG: Maf family protein [Alkalilacustris sp.]
MTEPLILASASIIRATLLRRAGVIIEQHPARIDEEALRDALQAEGAGPRDLADALAEHKARKASQRCPGALVLGCDQVLDLDGVVFAKPVDRRAARDQLMRLRGATHRLHSAAVLYRSGAPLWRHVGVARLSMRVFSEAYLDGYLDRGWPDIASSVGAYRLEEEGVRLFSRIDGCHFTVLGLPLLELLVHLGRIGAIEA